MECMHLESLGDASFTLVSSKKWESIIKDSIYEYGSLRSRDNETLFMLCNPPGLAAAYSSIKIRIDGKEVPSSQIGIRRIMYEPDYVPVEKFKEDPLLFFPGEAIEIKINNLSLEQGMHRIEVFFYTEKGCNVWISVEDEVF